jgi:uncharacterized protein YoxC
MDWNLILVLVEIIALGALSVLSVYLITVLVRVRDILAVVEHDVKEVSARAIPVLENLESITDNVRKITDSIEEQVDIVKHSINSVREIADNIAGFERRIQSQIEEPMMETIGTVTAIIKGFQAFFSRLRTQPSRPS